MLECSVNLPALTGVRSGRRGYNEHSMKMTSRMAGNFSLFLGLKWQRQEKNLAGTKITHYNLGGGI